MAAQRTAWCSWCYERTNHTPEAQVIGARNRYLCSNCNNETVKCIACTEMARGRPDLSSLSEDQKKQFRKFKVLWRKEFCAEHDGSVGDFSMLSKTLSEIEDYDCLFTAKKPNLANISKVVTFTIGSAVVMVPVSIFAAPGVASALGASGLLGAAGTGTAISSLSGAALTSASLAAIGTGSIASGTVIITAAGAALGGTYGGVISNRYYREVKDLRITKLNEGESPSVLFVNGFLTQEMEDLRDWKRALRGEHPGQSWYHLNWESKTLLDLGNTFLTGVTTETTRKIFLKAAKRAARKAGSRLSPITWAGIIADLASNPWNIANRKAAVTGVWLAEIIARSENQRFILIGHSLGARVIHYALQALSTKDNRYIDHAILLGGAQDTEDEEGWISASDAIDGKLINCYSINDNVLRWAYQASFGFTRKPCGLGPIAVDHPNLMNHDYSDIISSHKEWKDKLQVILGSIDY